MNETSPTAELIECLRIAEVAHSFAGRRGRQRLLLLTVLRDRGPTAVEELQRLTGVRDKTMVKHLHKLRDLHLVEQSKRGALARTRTADGREHMRALVQWKCTRQGRTFVDRLVSHEPLKNKLEERARLRAAAAEAEQDRAKAQAALQEVKEKRAYLQLVMEHLYADPACARHLEEMSVTAAKRAA